MIFRRILRKIHSQIFTRSHAEEFKYIKKFSRGSIECIVDVGANIGQSAVSLHRLFPHSTIHCLEPVPATFRQLKKNIRLVPNTKCYCLALGRKSGSVKIHLNKASESNSLLPNKANFRDYTDGWDGLEPRGGCTVKISTLDAWLKKYAIKRVDFLKIDTQGSDIQVLYGARQALNDRLIRFISVEAMFVPIYMRQGSFCKVMELLSVYEFQFCGFFNHCWSPKGNLKWADAVFRGEF